MKRYRTIPRFGGYSRRIQTQLSKARGLIGYSLRANLLKRDFWTLSVWEGKAALMEFVHKGFHSGVMVVLRPDIGATDFIRWQLKGSQVPPAWEEALRRWKS